MCCPELKPQMTGVAALPGEDMLNESVTQSPKAAPTVVDTVPPTSAEALVAGPAMLNVVKSNLSLQMLVLQGQMEYVHGEVRLVTDDCTR